MDFEEKDLPVSSLLLDPNDIRYQDESEFVTADERRFHEESVQDRRPIAACAKKALQN